MKSTIHSSILLGVFIFCFYPLLGQPFNIRYSRQFEVETHCYRVSAGDYDPTDLSDLDKFRLRSEEATHHRITMEVDQQNQIIRTVEVLSPGVNAHNWQTPAEKYVFTPTAHFIYIDNQIVDTLAVSPKITSHDSLLTTYLDTVSLPFYHQFTLPSSSQLFLWQNEGYIVTHTSDSLVKIEGNGEQIVYDTERKMKSIEERDGANLLQKSVIEVYSELGDEDVLSWKIVKKKQNTLSGECYYEIEESHYRNHLINRDESGFQGGKAMKAHSLSNDPQLSLSPNPASTHTTLHLPEEPSNVEPIHLYLFDASGKVYLKKVIQGTSSSGIHLDVTSLSDGIYFVQAVSGKNNQIIRLIVH